MDNTRKQVLDALEYTRLEAEQIRAFLLPLLTSLRNNPNSSRYLQLRVERVDRHLEDARRRIGSLIRAQRAELTDSDTAPPVE